MDPSTMHEVWLNLATNSPFLAFLVYNWYQMSKQNEAYRLEMKNDRDEYERKREEGIEKIRERYQVVIEDLKQQKSNGIEERLVSLEKGIKKLFHLIDKLKEEINDLKFKEKARDFVK